VRVRELEPAVGRSPPAHTSLSHSSNNGVCAEPNCSTVLHESCGLQVPPAPPPSACYMLQYTVLLQAQATHLLLEEMNTSDSCQSTLVSSPSLGNTRVSVLSSAVTKRRQ
jgi:hypothetical protein